MNLDRDQLQQAFRSVAMPALVGAAGGGALGAYMTGGPQAGETSSQRRHRVLRNALISAGLGGAAGATLPIGLKTLAEPYTGYGATGGPGLIDKTLGAVANNAAPIGALALGGVGLHKYNDAYRNRALKYILANAKGPLSEDVSNITGVKSLDSLDQVKHLLGKGDAATKELLSRLTGRLGGESGSDFHNLFHSAEMLQQAGHPQIAGSDLTRLFGGSDLNALEHASPHPSAPVAEAVGKGFPKDLSPFYSEYLKSRGLTQPLSKLLGHAPGAAESIGAARAVPALNRVAELYSRFARPGASRTLGRMLGPLGGLGLLGAGAYGANWLQNKVVGN